MRRLVTRMRGLRLGPLQEFLRAEAAGGVVLLLAVAAALLWANAGTTYARFWHHTLTLGSGAAAVTEDLQHWVNDGLMTVFFFAVGLEIKRELAIGELRNRRAALLPAIVAAGGVLVPIALFTAIIGSGRGGDAWGVPMATDIAFAVGILALLGSRVSSGAKLFLLSVAIVDDILAVIVVAAFYSGGIDFGWLGGAAGGLVVIVVMKRLRTPWPWAYVPIGVVVWFATLESGVHATIAGVAIGLITPAGPVRGRQVLEHLEHRLHPISAFVVVPAFALANAGVDLRGGVVTDALSSSLTWAIVAGLSAGKLLGIGLSAFAALRLRIGELPGNMHPREIWGVAALGGVGFTVALFVADLALSDPALTGFAKIGIFIGSTLSALLGVGLLLVTPAGTTEGARDPGAERDS